MDAETKSPVEETVVVLLTPNGDRVRTAQSDSLGKYSLVNLNPGRYKIKARRVGYEEARGGPFPLSSGDTLKIDVELFRSPVEMNEVTVEEEVERRLDRVGYYERKKTTSGQFLDRTEIKNKHASQPSELFTTVPGMQVKGQVMAGMKPWVQTTGRTTINQGAGDNPCVPSIVVDGTLVRVGGIIDFARTRRLNDLVSVSDIQAVESYRNSTDAPAEYGGPRSPCGLILIWTGRAD